MSGTSFVAAFREHAVPDPKAQEIGRARGRGRHVAPGRPAGWRRPLRASRRDRRRDGRDGSVVIAAITSCTNTSNPSVMVAAGLLAQKAVEAGLERKPWVKTSLAPGSRVVTDYLDRAGLTPYLEKLGFRARGLRLHDVHRELRPAARRGRRRPWTSDDLDVVAVLSGNRNFEGRIHPQVRASYLASPPLVRRVRPGRARSTSTRRATRSATAPTGPVFLRDLWPVARRGCRAVARGDRRRTVRARSTARIWDGDERWRALPTPTGRHVRVGRGLHVRAGAAVLRRISGAPAAVGDIEGARVLVKVGDSITTDHISPAGTIKADSPGRSVPRRARGRARDFNSYGSRRGNHQVMMRGTFANIRLRNELAPGTEGSLTTHLPDGEVTSVFDAVEALPGRRACRSA